MNPEYLLKRAIMKEKGYYVVGGKFSNDILNSTFMCSDINKMSVDRIVSMFKECFNR